MRILQNNGAQKTIVFKYRVTSIAPINGCSYMYSLNKGVEGWRGKLWFGFDIDLLCLFLESL